jgi:SnoaL-like domain
LPRTRDHDPRLIVVQTWELVAREAIRDTIAAYTDSGDRYRLEDLAATFAGDGVLEIKGSWRATGRAAIVERLSAPAIASRPRPDGFFIRHFVTNIRFVSVEPDSAQTTAYFLVLTPDGPDHWGRYRDSFTRHDDQWLFAHRHVSIDALVANAWFANPADSEVSDVV